MKVQRKWWIVLGLAVLAGIAIAYALNRKPAIEHFTARVEKGDIDNVVEATGTINAVITVQVGSQVSGTIAKLYVDFNSRVRKGQVIALIDPALFQGALQQATADLQNAQANLVAARANVEKAQATLVQVKADYDRSVGLMQSSLISQQQLDLAKATYDAGKATLLGALANVKQAEAQVSQKAAAVNVAQTNLNYTVIRSPIDGTVVARNVDVGQTVAASLQAPTIFTIAQDLSKMWVYAKTDESDVGNIKIGKPVTFKVDAFPKDTFHGVVSQVRMNATTVQSVVTYDTIIEFANPELKLFPGMTAYVTIPVASVTNVLKLPNTALRYKPPIPDEQILAMYRRYGIEGAKQAQVSAETQSSDPTADPQPASAKLGPTHGPKTDVAVVWKRHSDNSMEPVQVALGITDHAYTEIKSVLKGELKEGDNLIIRSITPNTPAPGAMRR